jgi:hypothetical protein
MLIPEKCEGVSGLPSLFTKVPFVCDEHASMKEEKLDDK